MIHPLNRHSPSFFHQRNKLLCKAAGLGILLLFFVFVLLPKPIGLQAAQGDTTAQNPPDPKAKQTPPPPPPKLSILLLIDVSGSMNDNNKIDQAKTAAINAINAAIKPIPAQASQPQTPVPDPTQSLVSAYANSPIPGIPPLIARQFTKNLDALDEIQKLLGPDIRTWINQTPATEMGKVLKNCQGLMKGLAFEQQSILMQRLNPLVERMHYSIAAKVNEVLKAEGKTLGLKYVIPGKTPAHGEFGGLFTLKPSDHDAIYLGQGADDAVRLHKELAATYGDDFLTLTESCLESSKYTIERLTSGALPEAFENFSGPMSNLDWMRSKSGSAWVQRYVDKAGTVVDLDALDDVAKIKPAGEPGSALKSLSSYTDDQIRDLGIVMERSAQAPAFNLGLQSDFERQLALNRARKGLEKGLATSSADDTAMLLSKYGPRYQEVLEGAGIRLEQTAWNGYVDKLKAAGNKAKHGQALSAADQAVVNQFDEFAGFVRQQSIGRQLQEFARIKQGLIDASSTGDDAAVAALRSQMTDVIDDTQAALHNYQQLYGKAYADDLIAGISQTHDDFARGLTRRLTNNPWVVNEQSIEFSVQKELAAQGNLPSPGSTVPSSVVISDSQSLWQYARQNPGHVFAKAAQYGAYAWMGYEVLGKIKEGKDAEALQLTGEFVAAEAAVRGLSWGLASKGAMAGPAVFLAAMGGYTVGKMASQWAIDSQVNEMSLQMMSGYSEDGSRTFGPTDQNLQGGMLEYLTRARATNEINQNTGQTTQWVDFDAPSEAANMTDAEILAQIKPGTYGDSTTSFDANGNLVVEKQTTRWQRMGGDYIEVPFTEHQTIPKSQIIAHTRMQQMYQAMRGKYNAARDSGEIQGGNQSIPSDFSYVDPYSNIPGSEFSVPNTGKMSVNEFTYYRMMFERTWNRWSLDKNEQWNQSSMYWGANMENAYKAKWSMFQSFIAGINEGKIRDAEFQKKLADDSPENLAALKILAEKGVPFFVDGKKLTVNDIQKMIDKKLEERQAVLDQIKEGVIQVDLPEELEKVLSTLGAMALGDVEIGIMPYSGSCSSNFSLFGFSRDPEELKTAINSLSAGGGTPMSPALYQARYALAKYGQGQAGTIILLCDGQNSCSENPVEAADQIRKSVYPGNPGGMAALLKKLGRFQFVPSLLAQDQPHFRPIDMNDPIPANRRNLPITVSTVGFQVSSDQQRVLDEIAQAGGGVSGSAQNMDQLTQAFSSAILSASEGFSSGGGGGYVMPSGKANWPLILLVFFILASAVAAGALLILRGRKTVSAAAPAKVLGYADVTYSDGGIKSVPLTKMKITIGRDEAMVLVIHDEQVSSHHADLYITEDGIYVIDSGSSNGTFINGQSVGKAWVKPNDVISLGTTQIHIRT